MNIQWVYKLEVNCNTSHDQALLDTELLLENEYLVSESVSGRAVYLHSNGVTVWFNTRAVAVDGIWYGATLIGPNDPDFESWFDSIQTTLCDAGIPVDEVTLALRRTAEQDTTESRDVGALAKDRLTGRRRGIAKRFLIKTIAVVVTVSLLILFGLSALAWNIWEDRTYGDEILFGTCFVDLDDARITGKRQFIRPFTDVAGMRYINPKLMSESVIIDNEHYGLIVVSMQEDGDSHVTIMRVEMGPYVEVPLGSRYLFVYDEESEVIEHEDLCF